MTDKSKRRRRWWKLPAVWIEPVRGYMCVLLLTRALQPDVDAEGFVRHLPLAITLFVLAIGLTVQALGTPNKDHLIAPAGFLAGILLAWMPACVSVPCLVLASSSALAFRHWEAGFLIGSVACVTLGYFFVGPCVKTLGITLIFAWPLLLTWLLHRKMVLPVRS